MCSTLKISLISELGRAFASFFIKMGLNVILSSWDSKNIGGRTGEITVRFPTPIDVGSGATIHLKKLVVGQATRGPIFVCSDAGSSSVLSNGDLQSILGVYFCQGRKNQTYSFGESELILPVRVRSLSSITLSLINPTTSSPVTFHQSTTPVILAHLEINSCSQNSK